MATLCRDCLSVTDGEDRSPCPGCRSPRRIAHPALIDLDIAHVDCDAFYAAVEKRDNPSLRDKPVIVGHPGGRGVVTTACYVARRFGPRSAMPMFKALQLCPDAIVIPPDMAKYKRASAEIQAILAALTPSVEPVSVDEAYLDLSGGIRFDRRTPAVLLAEAALAVERDVGVTVSVGLAGNKFIAKLASDLNKPRGFAAIGADEARSFLAPLSVRKIHGIGHAGARRLADLGIETIGQLQGLSEPELVARFGRFGHRLALYVQGHDDRRVTPERETKSVSAETTFSVDHREEAALNAALQPLCERVAARLQRAHLAGRNVVLKLKTDRFRVSTRSYCLADPTNRADVVHDAARMLLRRETDGRAFRLIGVGVSGLCPADRADPPTLFDPR